MLSLVLIRLYLLSLLLLFGCDWLDYHIQNSPTNPSENIIFSGITETDSNGNMIGNIDSDDWCQFDMNLMDSGYGLNPIYPNPVTAQNSELFGYSYQICFQYSTPYDSTSVSYTHLTLPTKRIV